MRLDVRLEKFDPLRDVDRYLELLNHYDMRTLDRDQPQRLALTAQHSGALITAVTTDSESIGFGRTDMAGGIPMQAGIVVAEEYQNEGIGTRISHAIKAAHRLRGVSTVESLSNAPIPPIALDKDWIDGLPEDIRRTIKWHINNGFKLSFSLFGWEADADDVISDFKRELAEIRVTPDHVRQAFDSLHKVHTRHPLEARKAEFAEIANQAISSPSNIQLTPIKSTSDGGDITLPASSIVEPWFHDCGVEPGAPDARISSYWVRLPSAVIGGEYASVLQLASRTQNKDEKTRLYGSSSSGFYVAQRNYDEAYEVVRIANNEARHATPEEIYFVESRLVLDAWYLNLTNIQRHVYKVMFAADYHNITDTVKGKPLNNIHVPITNKHGEIPEIEYTYHRDF